MAKKMALDNIEIAKLQAAETYAVADAKYNLTERGMAAAEVAKDNMEYAKQQSTKQAALMAERTANYRAGKGFMLESKDTEGKEVRKVTYKECFLRSQVIPNLITSFAAEKATPGSESVRAFATILKFCLHGSAEWQASVAEAVACLIPPTLRGRDTKRPLLDQLTLALQSAMVDAEIEAIQQSLASNREGATQLTIWWNKRGRYDNLFAGQFVLSWR